MKQYLILSIGILCCTSALAQEKPAEKLSDRIKKMEVDGDFKRVPIYQAFERIGKTLQAETNLNARAFKFAGLTRNMPVTLELGKVTAEKTLGVIVEDFRKRGAKLAISLDEEKNTILLTTETDAKKAKLKIYDFPEAE